jgi:uncharacterized protein YgiB involved in biofilm formation
MKHTKTISLVLISTMTAVTLSACSSEPEPPNLEGQKIFSSVGECVKDGGKGCKAAHDKAAISHLMSAPRYVNEGICMAEGHEKCVSVALAGATVWLPLMVGFMANNRPIYLQKYNETTVEYEDDDGNYVERPLTADEKKERRVVAGGSAFDSGTYGHNSVVVVGGWYPTRGYYSYGFNRGGLTQGIGAANARVGISSEGSSSHGVSRSSGSSGRGVARAVSSRGGFGGSARGFGGS